MGHKTVSVLLVTLKSVLKTRVQTYYLMQEISRHNQDYHTILSSAQSMVNFR